MWYPAQLWEGTDYTGNVFNLPYDRIGGTKVPITDNAISSLKVQAFTQLTLFDGNLNGENIVIQGPAEIPNLGSYLKGFDDKTSSYRLIRTAPHADAEYQCCGGQSDPIICGEYIPGAPPCDRYMPKYCDVSRMGRTDCQNWCNEPANYNECLSNRTKYCEKNAATDPFCGAAVDGKLNTLYTRINATLQNNIILIIFFLMIIITGIVLASSPARYRTK